MTEERFASVWDAIENSPASAANMKTRASLMMSAAEAPSVNGDELPGVIDHVISGNRSARASS